LLTLKIVSYVFFDQALPRFWSRTIRNCYFEKRETASTRVRRKRNGDEDSCYDSCERARELPFNNNIIKKQNG
jgi:hypothetical protein